jgi:hypothetical protein
MSAFEAGAFGGGGIGAVKPVAVEIYTSAYRVSGTIETRFSRVTEILNQQSGGHLTVIGATVSEHADPAATLAAPTALVTVDEVLIMVAADLGGSAGEMRIQKHQVRAQLAIPPFRVTGTIHVPMGSRAVDGLLLGTDQFIAMTDATIASGIHPDISGTEPVIALRRGNAHVLIVADDEAADGLLAEVLDERTAEAWLRPDEEGG